MGSFPLTMPHRLIQWMRSIEWEPMGLFDGSHQRIHNFYIWRTHWWDPSHRCPMDWFESLMDPLMGYQNKKYKWLQTPIKLLWVDRNCLIQLNRNDSINGAIKWSYLLVQWIQFLFTRMGGTIWLCHMKPFLSYSLIWVGPFDGSIDVAIPIWNGWSCTSDM